MARQKQKKKRNQKRPIKGPAVATPAAPPKSPLTQGSKSRTQQGAVRRGERQPGRSS